MSGPKVVNQCNDDDFEQPTRRHRRRDGVDDNALFERADIQREQVAIVFIVEPLTMVVDTESTYVTDRFVVL